MKIKCIIIEDEPLALEKTKQFAQKLPYLELCGTFDNAFDALNFLNAEPIGLIFLDINLGGLTGINLLETSEVKSQVIFTTAYQEYAVRAFDLKAADYLLKPFTLERFIQAVGRARENLASKQPSSKKTFIFVKTENRLEKVFLKDILFIEGMRDYRRIHTSEKKIMTLQTFSEFEKLLPSGMICRIHRSYMAALPKIDSIEKDKAIIRGVSIPISDTYRKLLFQLIGQSPASEKSKIIK